jgi:hypothetical protein
MTRKARASPQAELVQRDTAEASADLLGDEAHGQLKPWQPNASSAS